MEFNQKLFVSRLRELLDEKEITQKELSSRIGVSEVTVSRYLSGDRTPRTDVINSISNFFNVSADYLLGNSDIRNPYENHQRISESIKDDKELLEFWEVLKEREDLQLLFKQTKQMTEKDIRQIIKIIKAIEDEEDAQN
ncbi:helix-turn-helix transcriptional regulator [Acetoanaerobium noterae]|uniref:helix-turn-helix domain-containing protein n=1 Tax=Acetoanaerobium noterae TaxID=745369 RepID=UPI0028AEBB9B|nr:helix-turn-helix transcriptional regulator [Acetoanaerobium noterae]